MSDKRREQIFGWTEPTQPPPGEYVRFINAFELDNGIEITIRRPDSTIASIELSDDEATELALMLLKSGRCRELASAGISKKVGAFDT